MSSWGFRSRPPERASSELKQPYLKLALVPNARSGFECVSSITSVGPNSRRQESATKNTLGTAIFAPATFGSEGRKKLRAMNVLDQFPGFRVPFER